MPRAWPNRRFADLGVALAFCTRLPLALAEPIENGDVARAAWALPLAGVMVGACGALAYGAAFAAGLAAPAAAVLALAVTVAMTGCLHEDGLADTADGFGGGRDREHKLAIMRDSRIGTYGVCALTLSLMLRASALAAIAQPGAVALALIAAHAAGRAVLPACMRFIPPARSEGLSAAAGRPPALGVAAALLLGVAALGFALGVWLAAAALALVAVAVLIMARLAVRQIGGQTGDVLGATEQLAEIAVLLAATAARAPP
jgi:adenosylcobinamide-GDP ribazoletransferase